MHFLNPALAWGVLAAAGPLIIHWIHQNRHRTMPWAATLFLKKTASAHPWWSRLRHWLLLASRTCALAALALAFSRPMTGEWLPGWFEEKPECIVLILDRSSSMEAPAWTGDGPPRPELVGFSKRAHALRLWQKASENRPAGRWIFFENVLRTPLELSTLSGLDSLPLAGPTDTAADLPALLLAAVRHLQAQQIGRAEIWIASDMQSSNWKPDSPDWEVLREHTAGWKGATLLRLLDLSSTSSANVALSLRELRTQTVADGDPAQSALRLGLKIRVSTPFPESLSPGGIRLLLNLRGAVSTQEIELKAAVQTQLLTPATLPAEAGWGSVELPSDGYPPDNAAFFAWPKPTIPRATVVGREDAISHMLQLACAPDPDSGRSLAEILQPNQLTEAHLQRTDFVVWNAGPIPRETARRLSAWLRGGGFLLQMPPDASEGEPRPPSSPPSASADRSQPEGASASPEETFEPPSWLTMESSTPAFAVALWEETEGPLARTESGQSLPVSSLDIQRRQIPVPGRAGIVLGTYADGRPFLVRQTLGRGGAFALSTAAQESWSSLAEGTVLVPLIQRMLTTAAQQRRPASMAVAGEWKPDADEAWIPVTGAAETERSAAADARKPALADPRWRAGVYQFGGRWMALNRPDIEDETPLVPASELHGMLPLIPIRTLEQAGALSSESLQKELWPALSALLVLTLLVEMALCGIESRTAPPHALAKKSSAP